MGSERLRWPGRWWRVALTIPRIDEDIAVGRLSALGAIGAATRPAGPRRLWLDAWFGDEACAAAAATTLCTIPGTVVREQSPIPVEDPGWLAASARARRPRRVGRLVIRGRPPARRAAGSRCCIVVPAGRAFGTGEHPTTRMCLLLLQKWMKRGAKVLDLGAGSAILAVAAARLGAHSVLALDNDEHVIDVARDNVRANRVGRKVCVQCGSWPELAPAARFDMVLANIHRSALVRGARAVAARIRRGGCAVLSGFSPEDKDLVARAWRRAGATLLDELREGEWSALVVGRPAR